MRTFLLLPLLLVTPAAAQQPREANYDESKAGNFTLPDPLVFADGTPVRTAAEWRNKRRGEVLRLFEQNVYGKTPAVRPFESERTSIDKNALNGAATREEVTLWLAGRQGPRLNLLIYKPNKRKGRAPVFLGPNFTGNHTVNADPGIKIAEVYDRSGVRKPGAETARGSGSSRWQVEKAIGRGYATATFYYQDVFADNKDGRAASIIPYFEKDPAPDSWNAIGAWAYSLSRALDYLSKDRDIDARRVILHGHSRLGKTALWAGAQDERFAIVISNNSGEGGAALARRDYGETVHRINYSFPHWFNANFKQYNARVNDLPVDQHMLIALIAPRPVYVTSAVEDRWADPHGEFLSALSASPVYKLLGVEGMTATAHPPLNQPVMSRIGYHIRSGVHDVTAYDWDQFMNFADKHLPKGR
ncbi:MAG: acetylxylan esterase [Acidobacteria bacterium]|nr:acetylxylan esterase [Acidobacteriota bacterium]